jgi:hypothetical protein
MEAPLIGDFVEDQHEINSPAWSGKTTDGLASRLDCRLNWNLVSNVLSEPICISNFNVDDINLKSKFEV